MQNHKLKSQENMTINKADYPPRSKKIFNLLKILSLTKNCNHQLGGCLVISNKNHVNIIQLSAPNSGFWSQICS